MYAFINHIERARTRPERIEFSRSTSSGHKINTVAIPVKYIVTALAMLLFGSTLGTPRQLQNSVSTISQQNGVRATYRSSQIHLTRYSCRSADRSGLGRCGYCGRPRRTWHRRLPSSHLWGTRFRSDWWRGGFRLRSYGGWWRFVTQRARRP